jgi:hypothetical protein
VAKSETAKDLLMKIINSAFSNPEKAAGWFAEDGAFEMPYLTSFGISGRYAGRQAITGFFAFVR